MKEVYKEQKSYTHPGTISQSRIDILNSPKMVTSNKGDELLKSDAFEPIFDTLREILNNKNSQYTQDPIGVLSIDDLLCQIKIKAVRAQLAATEEKRIDELQDIIVYCMLTLDKIQSSCYGDSSDLETVIRSEV
jgi:hypothetical protein